MRISKSLLLPALACLSLNPPASSQVKAPRLGLVRYADRGVYPLYGVAGNYVVGPRYLDSVDALSFSGAGGLLVRRGALSLIDSNLQAVASFDVGADQPVVAIGSTLQSAIAWLPARHLLVNSTGSSLQAVPLTDGVLPGQVIGLEKIGSDIASLLLLHSDRTSVCEARIALHTGALVSISNIAAATGSVFRQADALLSLESGKLLMTSVSTGMVRSLPIHAQDLAFERVSETAMHLHSSASGRDWLLHLSADQPSLFELPAMPSGALR